MPPAGPRSASVRSKLIVNTILAVSFIAISAPQATRIPAHEWLSIAFIGVLALHLLFSWSWIVGVSARFMAALRGQVRFNYTLDALSYVAMVVVMVSGIVISESALPSLGFPRPRDRFWSVIHDLSSEALLVMIGVHLAMHWEWVVAASSRVLRGTLRAPTDDSGTGRTWLRPALTLAAVSALVTLATLGVGATSAADGMRRPGPRARAEGAAAGQAGARPRPTDASGAPAERRRATPKGRASGGANTLSWRQRYLRPGLKIGAFMGIPFLLTLALLRVARARRRDGSARSTDPLEQVVE